jgi:hypothetical protein
MPFKYQTSAHWQAYWQKAGMPACAEGKTEFKLWLEAAQIGRVYSFCKDCTRDYQIEMTNQNRCAYPKKALVPEDDEL